MILRKPYAFLIRYFKIIHILLLIPLSYIAYKTRMIYTFFNYMVGHNYLTNEIDIASRYIPFLLYVLIALVVGISFIIYSLMKEKNKKTVYYACMTALYLVLFFGCFATYSQMFTLENNDAVISTVRMYRDFSNILFWPQLVLILYTLFRGIGFDLKSFNFNKDLEELELEDTDDEEIEIDFTKNSYKRKRIIRKSIREFKYYVLENRFVFTCIISVISILIIYSLFQSYQVYNKKYGLGQAFNMNGLIVSVNDSILTNLSYDGNVIADDKYYLVLKVGIANRLLESKNIDVDNFRLYVNKKYIYPKLDRSSLFLDYGKCFFGGSILQQSSNEYNLVFELNKEDYKKSYELRVLDTIVFGIAELHPKQKIIQLNPSIQTRVEDMGTVKRDAEISLIDTTLNKTTYLLDRYEFSDSFDYTYTKCINSNCNEYQGSYASNRNDLLILEDSLEKDEDAPYFNNKTWIKDFYSDFMTIEYSYDGKINKYKVKNVTPEKYVGNKVILEVPKSARYATDAKLVINIRNRKASIDLEHF